MHAVSQTDLQRFGSRVRAERERLGVSQEELANDIGSYATTSVMDYPGDTSQDQRLLGKYDRAAMRFIYGDVLDVWAEPGVSVTGTSKLGMTSVRTSIARVRSSSGVSAWTATP